MTNLTCDQVRLRAGRTVEGQSGQLDGGRRQTYPMITTDLNLSFLVSRYIMILFPSAQGHHISTLCL